MAGNTHILNSDLENWMGKLPEQLKNIPIIYLAIPGSHDSMTYGITRNSGLAPDAQPVLRHLYTLFQGTILRWTITQAIDAYQQLLIGIRYFDLRVTKKQGSDKYFFTHGVYAGEIDAPLEQIKTFVDSHPDEVVILDFQHFYAFDPADHRILMRFIINLYKSRLASGQRDLNSITLNSLCRSKRQVIVIYRHQSVYETTEFWQPHMMPSPWPQQDKIRGLTNFLLNVTRQPGKGFVHQAVLTPTPSFILFRWTSNLRDRCAKPVKNEIYPKLLDFSPGIPERDLDKKSLAPINVVIADFVDLEDAIFSKTIIHLNGKLLQNPDLILNMHD